MRVTQRMMTDNAVRHMDENLGRMHALQEQIASGKAFQNASENPSGVTSALSLRSNLESLQGYLTSINSADDWMSANEAALQNLVEITSRAKDLSLSGTSDTLGARERQALGAELDLLLRQAIDIGNSQHRDAYLFSGFRTTTAPFTPLDNDADGLYDAITYQGDSGVIQRQIGTGQTIAQNIAGEATFSPVFEAMIAARQALNANNLPAIQNAVSALQAALEGANHALTLNGGRQRQVRQAGERMEQTEIELKSLLSSREDVNMAEAISNLRLQETVYQTVLEVAQRAISALSLFDMLR